MGTNCAPSPPPMLTSVFILMKVIFIGQHKLARSFNPCFRYIDDLFVFNNEKFWEYVKDVYPSQINAEKTNQCGNLGSEKLSTKLYGRRDEFDFCIVNFPFLSSNISSGPSFGLYISQLIRYARCCSCYDDFRHRYKMLVE